MEENDSVDEEGLNKKANNLNNSQESILIIHLCEDIIKIQDKKAIVFIGKQEELLKISKILKTIFVMLVKVDQGFILKFDLINFWKISFV